MRWFAVGLAFWLAGCAQPSNEDAEKPSAPVEKNLNLEDTEKQKTQESRTTKDAEPGQETSTSDALKDKGVEWLKDLSLSANSTFNTKYVWRGLAVVDQPVWQPDFSIGYGPLSFTWWGNMDMTRWGERAGYGNQRGEFTEIDYTIDVSVPINILTFSGGYVAYTFPHTGYDSTTELYTGVSVDMPLKPTLKVYFDVDEAKGRYGTLCFRHGIDLFKIGENVTVGAEACITGGIGSREFNDFYYGVDKCTMVDLQIDAGLPISVGEHFVVTPGIHWSKVVNPALREGERRNDTGWVGITTGLSF